MKIFLIVILSMTAIAVFLAFINVRSGTISNWSKAINADFLDGGFDADLWKAQYKNNKRENPRFGMVSTLEKKVLQKGMYREVVRKTLGLPEQIQGNSDLYDIGVSPFGIDYEQYVIEYNNYNQIIKFFVRRG